MDVQTSAVGKFTSVKVAVMTALKTIVWARCLLVAIENCSLLCATIGILPFGNHLGWMFPK